MLVAKFTFLAAPPKCRNRLNHRNQCGINRSIEGSQFVDSLDQVVCIAQKMFLVVLCVDLVHRRSKSKRLDVDQELTLSNQSLVLEELSLHLIEGLVLDLPIVR